MTLTATQALVTCPDGGRTWTERHGRKVTEQDTHQEDTHA